MAKGAIGEGDNCDKEHARTLGARAKDRECVRVRVRVRARARVRVRVRVRACVRACVRARV